jgi:hypothetical protein
VADTVRVKEVNGGGVRGRDKTTQNAGDMKWGEMTISVLGLPTFVKKRTEKEKSNLNSRSMLQLYSGLGGTFGKDLCLLYM